MDWFLRFKHFFGLHSWRYFDYQFPMIVSVRSFSGRECIVCGRRQFLTTGGSWNLLDFEVEEN